MFKVFALVNLILLPSLSLSAVSDDDLRSLWVQSMLNASVENLLEADHLLAGFDNSKNSSGINSPLHFVAKSGYLEKVKYLADTSLDKVCEANDGTTPLLDAVMSNQQQVALYLIRHYPQMNQPNAKQEWPIFFAAQHGNYQVVKELLQLGTHVNMDGVLTKTLTIALQENNVDIARLVMNHSPNPMMWNSIDRLKLVLHWSTDVVNWVSGHGNLEVIKFLIDNFNADVCPIDTSTGMTPLDIAVRVGNYEVVEFYISQNLCNQTNPQTGPSGITLLHSAARKGDIKTVDMILRNTQEHNPRVSNEEAPTPFLYAVVKGHLELVQHWCQNWGCDPLQRIRKSTEEVFHGNTAIHIAFLNTHFDVALYLMSLTDDKNPANDFGLTPLHLVIGNKEDVTAVKLITNQIERSNSCPIHASTELTPLHIAASIGKHEIVQLFISKKLCSQSNLETGPSGYTPLHMAARSGDIKTVDLILSNTQEHNPRVLNEEAPTPFIYAVAKGHLELVQHWCQNWGCDPLQRIRKSTTEVFNGNTAIHIAFANGHFDTALYLMSLTDDKNPVNGYGYTPLHLVIGIKDGLMAVKLITAQIEEKNPANRNVSQLTPMHLAANAGKYEVVEFFIQLLTPTASENPLTSQGLSCLSFAAHHGHLELVHLLTKSMPVHSNISFRSYLLPATSAFLNGHFEVGAYLVSIYYREVLLPAIQYFNCVLVLVCLLVHRIAVIPMQVLPSHIVSDLF